MVPYSAHMFLEAQREGVLPTVVAEQYAQLLVEVDGTWAESDRVERCREMSRDVESPVVNVWCYAMPSCSTAPFLKLEIGIQARNLIKKADLDV